MKMMKKAVSPTNKILYYGQTDHSFWNCNNRQELQSGMNYNFIPKITLDGISTCKSYNKLISESHSKII